MQLWQINIPTKDNNGFGNGMSHRRFAAELASLFGGFTSWEANGAWHNGERLYDEPVRVYQVACEEPPDLWGLAHKHFPDQKAFFVGRVGEASVINV